MVDLNFHRYLAGNLCPLGDNDETRRIIETQCVDAKSFEFWVRFQGASEFRAGPDGTIECYDHYPPDWPAGEVVKDIRKFRLPDMEWKEIRTFLLKPDENGTHCLGGERPSGFVLPHHKDMKTPFHYIGCIDGGDPHFSWLGVPRLHIAWPLFECCVGVYLNLSNPLGPIIMNPDVLTRHRCSDDLERLGDIVFEKTRYVSTDDLDMDLEPSNYFEGGFPLVCGIPLWQQGPEVPVCPLTKETMRCVVTIRSDPKIKVKGWDKARHAFSFDGTLCFADAGNLIVFYHPGSKIMHLQVQF